LSVIIALYPVLSLCTGIITPVSTEKADETLAWTPLSGLSLIRSGWAKQSPET